MTDREKLIESLGKCDRCNAEYCNQCEFGNDNVGCIRRLKEIIADTLLTNGVTFATDTNVGNKLFGISEQFKWISVEDRLPTLHDRILVWCESKTIEKHITACTYMGDGKFSRHVRCVTHWMPLPSPPAEGENE